MEGGDAAIQVLVQNLIDVTKGEISLIRGLKKNAEKLHNSLNLIQSYLDDAEKKLITDEAVKTWLKQLDDVAFDAHNVLDELNYHLLSKKMKSIRREKKKKKKVLPSCFSSFNHYLHRRRMALRINIIYTRFESSLDHATKLNLQSRSAAVAYALPEETDSFTLDPIFIGRENDVSDIVHKRLTKTEETLSVLPIVGMGGLGKTTLTRKIFNHERIQTHFGKKIWVHVSQNFDAMVLLKKFLANLTYENVQDESKEVLLGKIRKELGDKTYLLVLDDVWNEDEQKWQGLKNSLSGITSTKGNFIIVTTRSQEVASIVRTLDVHNLSVLSNEDCWFIIRQKTLSKEEDIPYGFESIGNNIIERCKGLPLAVNVVGGLLQRTPKDEWISTAEDWLSNLHVNDNDISKILRLSFDHLSTPSLKRCFAYCSIFSKGEEIDKQQLIELWMAQGFLQIDPKNGMEVEGNKFFHFLVRNSLLQVAKRDEFSNITHCSMHDLLHDLACIVSKGIYQVQNIGTKNGGDESSCIPKEQWRTLFFGGEVLSNTMLLNFKSLHALTLMDRKVEELPSSINKLIHLRLLNISSTQIRALPDSIGDLYHLQTLRANDYYSCLRELPSSVQYLINLRHLHVMWHTKLPPNIGKLTCLQTLECYHVGEEEGHKIGELGRLKNLRGDLHIFNLENVHHQIEAESAYIFEKQKMRKLVLEWSRSREGETDDDNVLEGLRTHPNLKVLEIIGFNGTRFPSWMKGLHNLMEVSLENCDECEEIPMMGQLPHLKFLSLSNLRKVKSIRSSIFKVDSRCKERNVVVFPVLKRLTLSEMPELVEWMEIEMGENEHQLEIKVFPCLEKLKISGCRELRMNPSHKELYPALHMCGSLIHFKIDRADQLEYLPDWFFLNNQNLSELFIRNCGKLRELPDGVETLNSLKVLDIDRCPNLKSIAYRRDGESQGLTSLERLIIRECEGLRILPCEMLQSNAPSLQTLYLADLSSLMNLAEIIDCMPKMSSLNSLCIWNVPKLISPAPAVFPNLQTLMMKADDRDSSESAKKGVDGMLQAASPHSLTFLSLRGMDDWDSLPHLLQHLNALSTLYLFNFGIEELPEWFGNLASLKSLYLCECKELRSVGIIRSLKKLTQLDITDCHPELKRWIGQQTDDVSHIPNIQVDRHLFERMVPRFLAYRAALVFTLN